MLLVQYAFVLCGAEKSLKFKECVFLSYAGMIRGAIALGLAIKAEDFFSEYEFVVASVLALVILSTLLFGSFMPIVAKFLLEEPKSKTHGSDKQGGQHPQEYEQYKTGNFSTPKEFYSLEQKPTSNGDDLMSGADNDQMHFGGNEERRMSMKSSEVDKNGPKQRLLSPTDVNNSPPNQHKTQQQEPVQAHDAKSVSSYSEMLHPNADPSDISQFGGHGNGDDPA